MVVDRASQRVVLMASSEGGMDIEEVAANTPEKIHKVAIDPMHGPHRRAGRRRRRARSASPTRSLPQARTMLQGLYRAFDETDASLAEINPLVVTGDGKRDRARRQAQLRFATRCSAIPTSSRCATSTRKTRPRSQASKFDLSYISLDGDIGCLVNGAGLAMATMDVIKLYGGEPGELPRRRRRRDRREGDRGVQDHAHQSRPQGDPRQHLRRHHEVRHDRRGHRGGA